MNNKEQSMNNNYINMNHHTSHNMCENAEAFVNAYFNSNLSVKDICHLLDEAIRYKSRKDSNGCTLININNCQFTSIVKCETCYSFACWECSAMHHQGHKLIHAMCRPLSSTHNCSVEKSIRTILLLTLSRLLAIKRSIHTTEGLLTEEEFCRYEQRWQEIIDFLSLLSSTKQEIQTILQQILTSPDIYSDLNSRDAGFKSLNRHTSLAQELVWMLNYDYQSTEAVHPNIKSNVFTLLESVFGADKFNEMFTEMCDRHCYEVTRRIIVLGRPVAVFDSNLWGDNMDENVCLEKNKEGKLTRHILYCLRWIFKQACRNDDNMLDLYSDYIPIKNQMYRPILDFLVKVLQICGMDSLLSCEATVREYMKLLTLLQGINGQTRQLNIHLEYESTAWTFCFPLEYGTTMDILKEIVNLDKSSGKFVDSISTVIAILQQLPQNREEGETSFHLPMHRFLSACLTDTHAADMKIHTTQFLSSDMALSILEDPLQLRMMVSQILSDMWRHNGDVNMKSQVMHYKSLFLPLDLNLIRLCALIIEPNTFVQTVFNRYNFTEVFTLRPELMDNGDKEKNEDERRRKREAKDMVEEKKRQSLRMLEEALAFISSILTSTTYHDIQSTQVLHKEMVSFLAISDRCFSEISQQNWARGFSDEEREACLNEVADYVCPSVKARSGEMKDGYYTLKSQSWQNLYDPLHVRDKYMLTECSKTFNRFTDHVKSSKIYTGKDIPWIPLRLPAELTLGVYGGLEDLLNSDAMLHLIHKVFNKTLEDQISSSSEALCFSIFLLDLLVSLTASKANASDIFDQMTQETNSTKSILTLLCELHTKLSGKNTDFYVPEEKRRSPASEEQMQSRIGGGNFFVDKLLDKMARASSVCKEALVALYNSHQDQQTDEDAIKKERARKRKEAALARMKKAQASFKLTAEQKDMIATEEENKEENVDLCVICNEEKEEEDVCVLRSTHKTNLLNRSRRNQTEIRCLTSACTELVDENSRQYQEMNISKCLATAKSRNPYMQDLCDKNLDTALYLKSCGHFVHNNCIDNYMTQQRRMGNRSTYTCPLCQKNATSILKIRHERKEEETCLTYDSLADKTQAIMKLLLETQQDNENNYTPNGGAIYRHLLKIQIEVERISSTGCETNFEHLFKRPSCLMPSVIKSMREKFQGLEDVESSIDMLQNLVGMNHITSMRRIEKPVLIEDTFAMLCKFVLASPSSLPKQLYQHLVSILYQVQVYQGLLSFSLTETVNTEETSEDIEQILMNIKQQLNKYGIREKLSAAEVECDVISYLKKETTSFLHCSAMLQCYMYGGNMPAQLQQTLDGKHSQLCGMLGLSTDESFMFRMKKGKEQFNVSSEDLSQIWLEKFIQFVEHHIPNGEQLQLRTYDWKVPTLYTPPDTLSQLKMLQSKPTPVTWLFADSWIQQSMYQTHNEEKPYVCLLCNSFMFCQYGDQEFEAHIKSCGGGSIPMLEIKSGKVMICNEAHPVLWGNLYLNKHGEATGSDRTLCHDRFELLHQQWLSCSFPH